MQGQLEFLEGDYAAFAKYHTYYFRYYYSVTFEPEIKFHKHIVARTDALFDSVFDLLKKDNIYKV